MNPSPIAQEYLQRGRSARCPIIDMHGHVGPFGGAYMPSAQPERMLHSMDRCGVQRIVCMHHVAISYEVERGNAMMQAVIDAHPTRFLGYWVINPNYPDIIKQDLDSFQQRRGFVGLKFWSDYHLVPVTSPKYAAALSFASERELLVMIHTWGESPFDAPALVGEIADRYPGARLLMAHCGHGEWETAAQVAKDLPNVYLDLTSVPNAHDFALMPGGSLMPKAPVGGTQINGVIEYLVETAGSHKVLFGSDLPWYSQHYHAGAILFARISDEARRDILHRNAERLLGPHLSHGET